MKITRQQAIELIDQRLEHRIYQNYAFGTLWPFGQFRGQDIGRLPLDYVIWHLINNDGLSPAHLRFFRQQIETVTHWDYDIWQPPAQQQQDPEGHYSGHYSGSHHQTGYYDGSR